MMIPGRRQCQEEGIDCRDTCSLNLRSQSPLHLKVGPKYLRPEAMAVSGDALQKLRQLGNLLLEHLPTAELAGHAALADGYHPLDVPADW